MPLWRIHAADESLLKGSNANRTSTRLLLVTQIVRTDDVNIGYHHVLNRHRRNDPDAEPERYVPADHVSIHCGEYDGGIQNGIFERPIDPITPRKTFPIEISG